MFHFIKTNFNKVYECHHISHTYAIHVYVCVCIQTDIHLLELNQQLFIENLLRVSHCVKPWEIPIGLDKTP